MSDVLVLGFCLYLFLLYLTRKSPEIQYLFLVSCLFVAHLALPLHLKVTAEMEQKYETN